MKVRVSREELEKLCTYKDRWIETYTLPAFIELEAEPVEAGEEYQHCYCGCHFIDAIVGLRCCRQCNEQHQATTTTPDAAEGAIERIDGTRSWSIAEKMNELIDHHNRHHHS